MVCTPAHQLASLEQGCKTALAAPHLDHVTPQMWCTMALSGHSLQPRGDVTFERPECSYVCVRVEHRDKGLVIAGTSAETSMPGPRWRSCAVYADPRHAAKLLRALMTWMMQLKAIRSNKRKLAAAADKASAHLSTNCSIMSCATASARQASKVPQQIKCCCAHCTAGPFICCSRKKSALE